MHVVFSNNNPAKPLRLAESGLRCEAKSVRISWHSMHMIYPNSDSAHFCAGVGLQ